MVRYKTKCLSIGKRKLRYEGILGWQANFGNCCASASISLESGREGKLRAGRRYRRGEACAVESKPVPADGIRAEVECKKLCLG